MSTSVDWGLNPRGKRWSARHGNPTVFRAFLAGGTSQSLVRTHALELNVAGWTRGARVNSTHPRFNHQALGVKAAVVVDEALNQNNILGLKPSGQPIDGPTLNVGEDWRAVGLDAGVHALRMDFDRLHTQTQRHVEMISAGLIGAKHSPSDARFCTFRRQQSIACGRGDRVGCGSNPEQHG